MKRVLVCVTMLTLAMASIGRAGENPDVGELRAKAEKGDAEAQFYLGVTYAQGEKGPKDPVEAVKWFRMAAEQGNADAQFFLGVIYSRGEGVTKDPFEAVKWYRKAAEQGDTSAQFFLALKHATGDGVAKDPVEAAKWFRKAAEQGNADAQIQLGRAYANGEGVLNDPVEAVKWYRKAAEQGDAEAQYQLGRMYGLAEGASKDPVQEANWYRKAAYQGHVAAQSDLGTMYYTGEGVIKDEVEALAWFNIAAASGYTRAVLKRDLFERRLGQDQTLVARQRSRDILSQIESKKARSPISTNPVLPPTEKSTTTPKATGSGAIVTAQGHVLTTAHVVVDAAKVSVVTMRGTRAARIVRVDASNDLAVLKIEDGNHTPLPLAPSRRVRVGQPVATVGFPNVGIQGFSPKVTRGEISSQNGAGDDPRAWQISVPVQTGNSGGPLLDEYGNLIGVVVAKLGIAAAKVTGDLPQNVNYAVKSAYALPLLEPYLGGGAPEPAQGKQPPKFEDMVAKAQQSVVLILAY